MRNLLLASLSAAILAIALPANATVLNGRTISNVLVAGTTYNISFVDTALSQMPQSFQFNFADFGGASAAITAVIATADYKNFIAPANTVDGTYYSGFIVPYGTLLSPTSRPQEYDGAVYQFKNGNVDNLPLYYYPTNDVNTTGDYSVVGYPLTAYALPSGQQFASLPEPASIAVVAFGLFGIGVLRRRA